MLQTKLPEEIHQTYSASKKATDKAIKWLLDFGHECQTTQSERQPVSVLKQAAALANDRQIKAPQEICYAFEDAIRGRTYLSNWFRAQHPSQSNITADHIYFSSFLRDVYNSVRNISPTSRAQPTTSTTDVINVTQSINQYINLEDEGEKSLGTREVRDGCEDDHPDEMARVLDNYFNRNNEPLDMAFAVHSLVLEFDVLCSKIKIIWEQAATGATSFVLAVWLSNAAYHLIRQKLSMGYYAMMLRDTGHEDFCSLAQYTRYLPEWIYHDEIRFAIEKIFESQHGILTPWRAILESRKTKSIGRLEAGNPVDTVKPTEVISVSQGNQDIIHQVKAERDWIDSFLLSMRQIKALDIDGEPSYLSDLNPIMEDIEDAITGNQNKSETLPVFGLQLLVESTKSYMFPKGTAMKNENCRLRAIGFALQVRKSVVAVIEKRLIIPGSNCGWPICTDDNLVQGLAYLKQELTTFIAHKRFDLYYQAPWVAGEQINWMICQANDYGMVLCNRRRYVGAVMHLYNCLRQLDLVHMEPILLERLCDILGEQVFRSKTLPRTDFWAAWKRYAGPELPWDSRHGKGCAFLDSYNPPEDSIAFHPRSRFWRLSRPKIPDDKRISLSKISHFYDLESVDYDFHHQDSVVSWGRLLGLKKGKGDATEEDANRVQDVLGLSFFAITLEKLQAAVGAELFGDFPIAKINWFAVYMTCTGILINLGKTVKTQESAARWSNDLEVAGVRWIEMFLHKADREACNRKARKSFKKEAERWIQTSNSAISRELQNMKTADYVWQV